MTFEQYLRSIEVDRNCSRWALREFRRDFEAAQKAGDLVEVGLATTWNAEETELAAEILAAFDFSTT